MVNCVIIWLIVSWTFMQRTTRLWPQEYSILSKVMYASKSLCYFLMQISNVLIALAYIYQALEKNIVIEFVLKFLGFFSSGFWFHWLASYFNKYSSYVVRISSLFCFILEVEPIIENPEGFRQLSYCYIKTTISLSIWVLSLWNRKQNAGYSLNFMKRTSSNIEVESIKFYFLNPKIVFRLMLAC